MVLTFTAVWITYSLVGAFVMFGIAAIIVIAKVLLFAATRLLPLVPADEQHQFEC
jgi:hypothetical protein